MAMQKRLPRRTFLRGVGATMALPWLEIMDGSKALGAATANSVSGPPLRMAHLFFPNGVWQKTWIPDEAGENYKLPFALEPLCELRNDFTVISGLDKAASREGDGHYAKTANFLTGGPVRKTTGIDLSVGGISLDQVVANEIGHLTPLPSIELSMDPVTSGIDQNVGFTRLYAAYISWQSASQPMAREINPRSAYERLFGARNAAGDRTRDARRMKDDQSLLDLVLEDSHSLRKQLGRDDRFKLEEYMDSVRAVEKRIGFYAEEDPRSWHPETRPEDLESYATKSPRSHEERVRLMLDLILLAFWTDQTRVATFMFGNAVSGRSFSFLDGVSEGHHPVSHHENKAEKYEQYMRINRWHTEQFGYLIRRLAEVKEGDGTLLDNSLIMMGSGISDGNSHNPNNLPILLAGRAGGRIKQGQHIQKPKDTPLCNLYSTMLEAWNIDHDHFGDSNGKLSELVV